MVKSWLRQVLPLCYLDLCVLELSLLVFTLLIYTYLLKYFKFSSSVVLGRLGAFGPKELKPDRGVYSNFPRLNVADCDFSSGKLIIFLKDILRWVFSTFRFSFFMCPVDIVFI